MGKGYDVAMLCGRFQHFHIGHQSLVEHALKVADRMNNNSTMANRDEDKKAAKTDETKALYVPLAEGAAKNDPKNAAFYTTAVKFFKQDIK